MTKKNRKRSAGIVLRDILLALLLVAVVAASAILVYRRFFESGPATPDEKQNIAKNHYDADSFYEENGMLRYAKSAHLTGVDVSEHQEKIDWAAVRAAGVDFAILRIGYRGYTEGSLREDSWFAENYTAARAAGVQVGVYFFSQATTLEEAREETERMLNVYADFCENVLAMPVTRGQKTDKEKFNGAEATYTIECMMHDRKALQAGTSHFFGDGFAKAFDIFYTDKNNQKVNPFQTSWGVSTRLIGGIIMTHGDNSGLVLPPKIAPVQIVIIPIAMHKEGVLEKARAVAETLRAAGLRVKLDESEQSPGWKFAEYEMKGVPLRLELGPKDIEQNQCVLVRRDNGEKSFVSLDSLVESANTLMDAVHDGMYAKAKRNLDENIYDAFTLEEAKRLQQEHGGFIRTMWCGDEACEIRMKEEAGMTSRCIPFAQQHLADTCAICGKPAKKMIYWGVAY